jgi:glycosyl transferase family 25
MALPSFLAHADHLVERKARLVPQLAAAALSPRWVTDFAPAEIVGAVDAAHFTSDSGLSGPQKSCAMKHVVILRAIVAEEIPAALVLEDDVALVPDFAARLGAILAEAPSPEGSYAIYLGSGDNRYPKPAHARLSEHLWRGDKARTTESYVVTLEAARRRLAWIEANRMHLPIDLLFTEIDPKLGVDTLWAHPPLTEQGSLNGAFRSAIDTDKAPFVKRLEFAYRKLRRWYLAGLPRR